MADEDEDNDISAAAADAAIVEVMAAASPDSAADDLEAEGKRIQSQLAIPKVSKYPLTHSGKMTCFAFTDSEFYVATRIFALQNAYVFRFCVANEMDLD